MNNRPPRTTYLLSPSEHRLVEEIVTGIALRPMPRENPEISAVRRAFLRSGAKGRVACAFDLADVVTEHVFDPLPRFRTSAPFRFVV